MSNAGFFIGFADFASPLSLREVADLLSSRAFGGIPFVEKEVDGEHLGALTLARDFLGIQVDLLRVDSAYKLKLGTRPSASVSGETNICNLSSIMKQRIETECKFVVTELPLDQQSIAKRL